MSNWRIEPGVPQGNAQLQNRVWSSIRWCPTTELSLGFHKVISNCRIESGVQQGNAQLQNWVWSSTGQFPTTESSLEFHKVMPNCQIEPGVPQGNVQLQNRIWSSTRQCPIAELRLEFHEEMSNCRIESGVHEVMSWDLRYVSRMRSMCDENLVHCCANLTQRSKSNLTGSNRSTSTKQNEWNTWGVRANEAKPSRATFANRSRIKFQIGSPQLHRASPDKTAPPRPQGSTGPHREAVRNVP